MPSQNSDSTNPPTTTRPTPQPDQAPPAQPANSAFLSPQGMPAAWPQSSIVERPIVQPTQGFMTPAGSIQPASFFAPELGDGAFGRAGDAKNRIAAAAAAPALFEAPAPLPTASVIAPVASGQSNAWSMPQVDRPAPRANSPSDEIPVPASDSFEMPVNQPPGK
jgi:hypothetical protein